MTTITIEKRDYRLRTMDKGDDGTILHDVMVSIPVIGGGDVRHIATAKVDANGWRQAADFWDVEIILCNEQWYTGVIPGHFMPFVCTIVEGEVPMLTFDLLNYRLYRHRSKCNFSWATVDEMLPGLLAFLRDECVIWNGKLLAATDGPPCISGAMYEEGPCIALHSNLPEDRDHARLTSLWGYSELATHMKEWGEERAAFEGEFVSFDEDSLRSITLHVAEPLPEWLPPTPPNPPTPEESEEGFDDVPF